MNSPKDPNVAKVNSVVSKSSPFAMLLKGTAPEYKQWAGGRRVWVSGKWALTQSFRQESGETDQITE